ncbi:MAG: hypothetical protein GY884_27400 [Proteobacteria bacterium]|nr:hypothetical protein [Pseudomonadota bacterium]
MGLDRLTDPATWGTGLSDEGARRALAAEVACIEAADDRRVADRKVLIWCAGNVFTAPLRWVHRFPDAVLKAPSSRPGPALAIGQAFGCSVEVLPHAEAFHLLDEADAVLGFGSDQAMDELASRLTVPHSLHGHRVSVAVVEDISNDNARKVAMDAVLHDGQGCRSPACVFVLGDAERFSMRLAQALRELAHEVPRGDIDPALGPQIRHRLGLGRVYGRTWNGSEWGVPMLPVEHADPVALPRVVTVHPATRAAIEDTLSTWPISAVSSDVELDRPTVSLGQLQSPPDDGTWEGVDILERLA